MSSSKVYKKEFEEMLRVELQMRDIVKFYLARIEDPTLLKDMRFMGEQEEEHVRIAQSFIDMVSQ